MTKPAPTVQIRIPTRRSSQLPLLYFHFLISERTLYAKSPKTPNVTKITKIIQPMILNLKFASAPRTVPYHNI